MIIFTIVTGGDSLSPAGGGRGLKDYESKLPPPPLQRGTSGRDLTNYRLKYIMTLKDYLSGGNIK
jgi:hypothetical protein